MNIDPTQFARALRESLPVLSASEAAALKPGVPISAPAPVVIREAVPAPMPTAEHPLPVEITREPLPYVYELRPTRDEKGNIVSILSVPIAQVKFDG
jgi:hypothetical protein